MRNPNPDDSVILFLPLLSACNLSSGAEARYLPPRSEAIALPELPNDQNSNKSPAYVSPGQFLGGVERY